MKNLKKVLALALAFAMAFSMFANAAFTDQATIASAHADDVAMLVELGVLGGYPDGSFKPQNTITRAEFTKMAYTIKYGYDDAGKLFAGSASKFTDVEGVSAIAWAKGYINYCANQNIIGGVGNNKFNPNGNVTVAEAAKMLLVILGCDAAKEGYGGSNWMGNVVSDAMELGVFDGWVGDPTAPATRELVATLMSNTLFAKTFVYSPVTGIGSQQNPLDPSKPNQILAEKTMGLKRIEGVVVANNAFALDVNADDEGKPYLGVAAPQGVAEKPYFTMAEEMIDESGKTVYVKHTYEYELPAEYLGAEVIVFATTKKDAENKIIGDVVLSSDSVIYDITSSDIRIIPDEEYAELGNTNDMLPYVSVNVGDKALQLKPRWDADRTTVPGDAVYAEDDLLNYFFFPAAEQANDATVKEYSGALVKPAADHPFYAELGTDGIQGYRAISLDGGKSIAYIVRTATKELTKVSKYSVDNDLLVIGTDTFNELEKTLVLDGEIARNDDVVTWREAGKVYVSATEEVIGKATIVSDNEVTIGDKNYKADQTIFAKKTVPSTGIDKGLATYFGKVANSNTDGSTYIAYNGYLLSAEATGTTVDVSSYAVVLDSYVDDDVPVVTLGFSDESSKTFEVSRINGVRITARLSGQNADFRTDAWDGNKFAGRLFRYAINSDGTVSLHSDSSNIVVSGNDQAATDDSLKSLGIQAGIYKNAYDANAGAYKGPATAEDAVVFAIYGGWSEDANQANKYYEKLKVAVFKLADMEATFAAQNIEGKKTEGGVKNLSYNINQFSHVMKKDKYGEEAILVSFPAGFKKPVLPPNSKSPLGILLSDVKYVDNGEGEFYANVKMITKDGLVETKTKLGLNEDLGDTAEYGEIMEAVTDYDGCMTGEFKRNTLVSYKLNDAGEIGQITIMATVADMQLGFGVSESAWSYASVASAGSKIKFYNYSESEIDTSDAKNVAISKNLDDHVYVWAIDGEEVVANGEIATFERGTLISRKAYNAILHADGENVDQVISFYGRI